MHDDKIRTVLGSARRLGARRPIQLATASLAGAGLVMSLGLGGGSPAHRSVVHAQSRARGSTVASDADSTSAPGLSGNAARSLRSTLDGARAELNRVALASGASTSVASPASVASPVPGIIGPATQKLTTAPASGSDGTGSNGSSSGSGSAPSPGLPHAPGVSLPAAAVPPSGCAMGSTGANAAAWWRTCASPAPGQITVTLPKVATGQLPSVQGPGVSLGQLPAVTSTDHSVTVDIGLNPQVTLPKVDVGNPVILQPAGIETH